jgi:hypothetical protein
MSEREFQPELDDELLSAYLDDELSAEERAAVEARLANDPDAQRLLHQLRSVSQSVQMLPIEGVGRDLSGEILRRIEAKKSGGSAAAAGGSAAIGEVTPRLPNFGSRRSWIWATVAVAAGLMIMVLERGEQKGKQLPAVAHIDSANETLQLHDRAESVGDQNKTLAKNGNNDEAKVAKSDTLGRLNVGSPTPSAAPSSRIDADKLASRELAKEPPTDGHLAGNPVTREPLAASRRAVELRDSPTVAGGAMPQRAAGSLSGSSDSKSQVAQNAEPKVAPQSESVRGENGSSTGFAMSTTAEKQGASEDADGVVVVHVSAKPAAIQGGEFEKLLARNGVEFDEKDKIDEGISSKDAVKRSVSDSAKSEVADRKKSAEKDSIDVVVVDAPRDVVAACMADLQHDESNFASVEVEQPMATEKSAATTANVAKQLGSELRQYNRGMNANKPGFGTRFYAADSAGQDRAQSKELNQPAAGNASPSEQNEQRSRNQRAAQANRGRALRVQVAQDEEQTLNESRSGPRGGGFGGGGSESDQMRRNVVQQQKPRNENSDEVRVLFMLSPEVATPGPSKKAAE